MGAIVTCKRCHEPFEVPFYRINKGLGKYCSKACRFNQQGVPDGQKRCARCGEVKPITDFWNRGNGSTKPRSACKPCFSELVVETRDEERHLEYKRRYYRENKHRWKEYCKTSIKNNPESKRETLRRWKRNNRERYLALKRAHQSARKANIVGEPSYSPSEWKEMCRRYGHRCVRCGKKVKLTQDHVIPLSRGGSNTIENIQPLCLHCNSSKYTKAIDYRPLFKIRFGGDNG